MSGGTGAGGGAAEARRAGVRRRGPVGVRCLLFILKRERGAGRRRNGAGVKKVKWPVAAAAVKLQRKSTAGGKQVSRGAQAGSAALGWVQYSVNRRLWLLLRLLLLGVVYDRDAE